MKLENLGFQGSAGIVIFEYLCEIPFGAPSCPPYLTRTMAQTSALNVPSEKAPAGILDPQKKINMNSKRYEASVGAPALTPLP
jgi:hypothetical protein